MFDEDDELYEFFGPDAFYRVMIAMVSLFLLVIVVSMVTSFFS